MSNWTSPLGRLRLAGYVEGVTLITLLFVAVPLKHFMGIPEATRVIGPIHGLSFVTYLVLTVTVVSSGGWSKGAIFRTVIVSIIPFGTFLNDPFLKRKHEGIAP